MKKTMLLLGAMMAVMASTAHAGTKVQDVQASAPQVSQSVYQSAFQCLATQLTPEQKSVSIGVLYVNDRTGKASYATEDASGAYLSQGMEDVAINDLAATGIATVEIGGPYRDLFNWMVPKLPGAQNGLPYSLPDLVVAASWTSLDFGDGSVSEGNVLGLGGGSRTYSLNYTIDARIIQMTPKDGHPGAAVRATTRLSKKVVGYETKGGLVGFFGPASSSTYLTFNVDKQRRELLQYSQSSMVDRTIVELVKNLYGITGCDEQIAYGDKLITGQFSAPSAK